MSRVTPPTVRPPTPPEGPASRDSPRSRRVRSSSSNDKLLDLANDQCVAPALASAIANHEAQRKASARAPAARRRGELPPVSSAPSPGKRSRRQFTGELEAEGADFSGLQQQAAPSVSFSGAVPMWTGGDLQLPMSPRPGSSGARLGRGTQSLGMLLPSPSPALASARGFGTKSADALDSPFSPTKKLKAMSLRSARLGSVSEAPPRKPGDLLTTNQHRLKQAYNLYDVHKSIGGGQGAAFAMVLRREFPNITNAEIQQIQQACLDRDDQNRVRSQVASRAWSEAEKRQLLTLFSVMDADGSGSISRHEFLEIASLANLGRPELGRAFDHMVSSDRRRTARTPGGSVELTLAQFTKLIESLNDEMLGTLRKAMPHLKQDSSNKMLVFDDGKQQLWRLVPGGRSLVRKPVDQSRGAASSKLTSLVSPSVRSTLQKGLS